MKCPKCLSKLYIKNGLINSLQRYKCKSCNYNFTVEKKSSAADSSKKRVALILYLEGVKVTTIANMLDVSHVSIIKWIKKYGNNLSELRADVNNHYQIDNQEINPEKSAS
ncbi:MAG: hypothetical protein WC716_07865 [Chitinophagaceae bacterium]|jgi:transposase-like protein